MGNAVFGGGAVIQFPAAVAEEGVLGAVEHSGELVARRAIKVVGDGFGVEGEGVCVVGEGGRSDRCRVISDQCGRGG